jgi:addiction module HigA family antidote
MRLPGSLLPPENPTQQKCSDDFLAKALICLDPTVNFAQVGLAVPSGRITDILNGRRSITADTAVRLGRYFGNRAQFWLDLQSQYDIARIEREHGAEISRRVRPADAA